MLKKCKECENEFEARKDYFHTCPDCWRNEFGERLNWCHAVKENGEPCRAVSKWGEQFCASHLKAGYGLFTLAAKRKRRPSQASQQEADKKLSGDWVRRIKDVYQLLINKEPTLAGVVDESIISLEFPLDELSEPEAIRVLEAMLELYKAQCERVEPQG